MQNSLETHPNKLRSAVGPPTQTSARVLTPKKNFCPKSYLSHATLLLCGALHRSTFHIFWGWWHVFIHHFFLINLVSVKTWLLITLKANVHHHANPFKHFGSTLILDSGWVGGGGGVHPSCPRAKAGSHPGRVACSAQGQLRETNTIRTHVGTSKAIQGCQLNLMPRLWGRRSWRGAANVN